MESILSKINREILPFLKIEPEGTKLPNSSEDWGIYNLPEAGGDDVFTDEESQEIFNLLGQLCYIDLKLGLQNSKELRCRVNVLDPNNPRMTSIGINPPLNLENRIQEANQKLINKGLSTSDRVVCYAYPKLGLVTKNELGESFIIDLGDYKIIPALLNDDLDLEFVGPYNVGDNDPISLLWKRNFDKLTELPSRINDHLFEAVFRDSEITEEYVLERFPLYPQIKDTYCAAASVQMIFAFFGRIVSQEEVAEAISVGIGGATNMNQINGIRMLSSDGFECEIDMSPSFQEAKHKLSHNFPMKSGVPRHARACCGWKTIEGINGVKKEFLLIHDPWPVNQGVVNWENWTEIRHTNFIEVRQL